MHSSIPDLLIPSQQLEALRRSRFEDQVMFQAKRSRTCAYKQSKAKTKPKKAWACKVLVKRNEKPVVIPDNVFQELFKMNFLLRKSLYGQVYMAEDKAGQSVVVKCSEKAKVAAGKSRHGFDVLEDAFQEVNIMHTLQRLARDEPHSGDKHICQLKGFYEDEKNYYTVLEYCSRGELLSLVKSEKRLSNTRARDLFHQIVFGVGALHDRGFCHLDISLENIMLDAAGKAVLIDLGVSQCFLDREFRYWFAFPNEPRDSHGRYIGPLPGKKQYMCPEIAHAEYFEGAQADVWSLGVCLFVMLCGTYPFPDNPPLSNPWKVASETMKKYGFHAEGKHALNPLAIDLLRRMLQPDTCRITLYDVLRHPWLLEDNPQSQIVLIARDEPRASAPREDAASSSDSSSVK